MSLPSTETTVAAQLAGKYTLVRQLGEGGMATVYEAMHQSIRKRVALKVLKGPMDDDRIGAAKRFEAEARASAMIPSPHVIQVSDFGHLDESIPYIVMELLSGQTLYERLQEGPLPLSQLVPIVAQVLDGLIAAHGAGVVHRDLKPSNVFLCDSESATPFVKVLDFGVARFLDDQVADLSIPDTAVALGTPMYMAPEQAFCQQVDGRADLYALGALMFRCLAGRYHYESKGVAAHVINLGSEDAIPLRSVAPAIDGTLAALVDRTLSRNPNERFASATEMLDALLAWCQRHQLVWDGPLMPSMARASRLPARASRSGLRRVTQQRITTTSVDDAELVTMTGPLDRPTPTIAGPIGDDDDDEEDEEEPTRLFMGQTIPSPGVDGTLPLSEYFQERVPGTERFGTLPPVDVDDTPDELPTIVQPEQTFHDVFSEAPEPAPSSGGVPLSRRLPVPSSSFAGVAPFTGHAASVAPESQLSTPSWRGLAVGATAIAGLSLGMLITVLVVIASGRGPATPEAMMVAAPPRPAQPAPPETNALATVSQVNATGPAAPAPSPTPATAPTAVAAPSAAEVPGRPAPPRAWAPRRTAAPSASAPRPTATVGGRRIRDEL